jgi:outer membrane protein TolC
MNIKRSFCILTVAAIALVSKANAADLPLSEYLLQVTSNNPSYKASRLGEQSGRAKADEANLVFLPNIVASAARTVDEREAPNPNFTGTKSIYNEYSLGISETTPFGLRASLNYNLTYRLTEGASPTAVPYPEYYTAYPSIELTQSLWRNGFGSEDRAQRDLLRADGESLYYQELFRNRAVIVEAQATYLRLYFLRETILALQNSLQLSGKLQSWAAKRAKNELADEGDFLQTRAQYEYRQLELLKAENDARAAARMFNSLRGIDSETVKEELAPVSPKNISPDLEKQKWVRLDVKSNEKNLEVVKANSRKLRETVRPNLELFAKYGYNNWENDREAAMDDAFGDYPVYTVGVRFSSPLAATKALRLQRGFESAVTSADYYIKRQKMDEVRDFKDLLEKIQNARARLELAKKLEATQKTKFENERRRHTRGRSTLFHVLNYEQDFVSGQLNRIQTELELHTLTNQLDLYEKENE